MKDRLTGTPPRLSTAVILACALAACGGGGGTRSDPPPVSPPPASPPATPPVVSPPNPAYSRHIAWTGADAAHAAGLTGAGIRIGIIDSGVNRNHPAMRDGRVIANLTYISAANNNLAVDDVVGHGTAVAQTAAGKPFGAWPGGIAPGAQIVSARIINDKPPADDGSGRGNEVNGALGLAPIHRDLINRGVRIMNNSWGGLYWTNLAATAPIAAEYRPFIIEHGGLVVFSAGNSGFADPSDTAALPSQRGSGGSLPAADLERGWLAVGALDADDPTRLAAYSNACGIAMHYCLVAPGTVIVTGTNDAPNAPEYWRWSGTSFAAPIVSGAAALVWEAFPYFDNDLVRQTLLGTARDLGAPGVDPVFGYGSLDIARAVQGPARFDWGDVVVDFAGTSTWSNFITGDGGLVKRGTGRLRLTWLTDYKGQTRVEGGVLEVGQSLSGPVTVGSAGTFEFGGANIAGNVVNNGTFAYIGERYNLAINGNYTQSATGTFGYVVGAPLRISGSATLAGEVRVLGLVPGYTHRANEDVLVADMGISGVFDRLTAASSLFLQGTLQYDDTTVSIDIARLDVSAAAKSLPGITAAGLSAARRIEHAFERIDRQVAGEAGGIAGDFIRIAGEFQHIDEAGVATSALESLSGASHARATSLAFDTIDMGRRALSTRLGDSAAGDGIRVWKQALGRGGETGFAGGDHALDGWLLGREHAFGPMVAGFAFGEARADDRIGWNGERGRERQAMAQLYAGRRFGDGYALAQVGSGRFDRTIERRLFAGDAERAGIFSHYGGDYATVAIEAGRHHEIAGLRLTPYLGAERTQLRSDAFEEVGGTGFGLRTDGGEMRRTQAIAGMRAAFDWRGASVHVHGEWQQTLDASGFDVAASFIGVDSWSPLPLADAAKSGGLVGFGIEAPLTRRSALLLGFDQRFGPRGDERMGSLRYLHAF
ncbi:MAG TPA: S8 family serine peptidase [Luteimonas sp.]|nr:S8 family serine peptidase [Luteimonas sp.]HRO27344.1 S8 family serine peptidase [Luteimonas sp.]HRP71162.1 S8 family serine peptidase [Luteimonas sp.]